MNAFKLIAYSLIGLLIMNACSSSKSNKLEEIKTMEDELFADESKMIDRAKAGQLIDLYIAFADEYPNDGNSVENLFKAGDLAMNLTMPRKAIEIFDRILNDYPGFEKAPQCLFLKGYVYENDLGDLQTAKKIYEEFLVKYPEDEFADDAEISIKNLGKTPEQLIKEFEEQARQEGNI